MVAIEDSLGMADPNWGWLDIHVVDGKITQVLRPKDPNAVQRSPINISFTMAVPVDSPEAHDLENANAFGYIQPIILPGDAVKDFKITGPRLVAWEGDLDSLEIRPADAKPEDFKPAEFVLRDKVGKQLGVYLASIQRYVEGMKGFTLRMSVGTLLDLTFRHPHDNLGRGNTHFSTHDFTGAAISDAFAVADFMVQFAAASSLEIHAMGKQIAVLEVEDRMGQNDLVTGFESIRSLLEDLMVIEAGTGARFRYPSELFDEERIMIRNVRLMLEGHCVAHPSFADVNLTLSGRDAGFSEVLTTELRWMMQEAEYAEITILGQQVVLPNLSTVAFVRLEQQDIDEVRAAFQRGDAAGMKLTFRGRPGDRVRMLLRDRFPSDKPAEITPWGIPGARQRGLQANGEPFS